ncbi:MAG: hypothetical protein ACI80V_003070 [Rhodothermales bacterium]|jgi:hypothetical protein
MASIEDIQVETFRSRSYPENGSRQALFGAELVQPLAACMLPVMLGALVYMLTGRAPLVWLTTGFPVAIALASAWTTFQLRRRVVEVSVRDEAVRVQSAWEATGGGLPKWLSVLDVRRNAAWLSVVLGHDERRIFLNDWPNAERLERSLREAAHVFAGRVRSEVG